MVTSQCLLGVIPSRTNTLYAGIQYPDIAYATQYGFAAVGTNNGHEGQSGGAWYHQPEVLKDFVWRALYTGVIVGKDITKQFYGKEHSKSYYIGCSTGGRQAWKAVQSYPDLFDGVIAGAPAIDFLGLLGWGGYAFSILGFNPNETLLTGDDWAHVHEIVLEQCDNIDGAKDGIVEDIRLCKPDFSIYVCNHGSSWCLTEEQISAIQKLFSPFVVDGKIYHSGAAHGDEVRLIETLYGPFMGTWLEEYFRFVVKEDLTWLRSQFTVSDAKEAMDQNPFNVQTFDTDISAFRDRGGKVLHWHGQADEYLAVTNSDRYYDSVAKTLNTSPKELDEFYRYFRISGMGHCFGGPGSNILGQGFGMAASDDPDDNVLVRIVEWVEKGNAPEIMRATKYNNDNTTQGIAYARKHCRYPLTNKYTGSGDGTDEEGWHCVSL